MIALFPAEFVDERIIDAFDKLQERGEVGTPITEAEAMKFVRAAYSRGYDDALKGVMPERVDSILDRAIERGFSLKGMSFYIYSLLSERGTEGRSVVSAPATVGDGEGHLPPPRSESREHSSPVERAASSSLPEVDAAQLDIFAEAAA